MGPFVWVHGEQFTAIHLGRIQDWKEGRSEEGRGLELISGLNRTVTFGFSQVFLPPVLFQPVKVTKHQLAKGMGSSLCHTWREDSPDFLSGPWIS